MEIARSMDRWRVLAGESLIHDSLESLAFEQGYRVGSVSHALGISEQHFRRVFYRDVGISVKEWMNSERMVVARRMLKWGIEPMKVSDALAFAHPNSFRREFRNTYGVTVSLFLNTRGSDDIQSRPTLLDGGSM